MSITLNRSVELDVNNPVKSVRYTPDGSVIGCSSSDSIFRVFSDDLTLPLLNLNTGDDIYDFDFYPGFDKNMGGTRAVLIGSRNRPIRLFNVGSGQSVSSYTAYSFTEEIVHPLSIRFSPRCSTIIGGFPGSTVRVWDVQTPSRQVRDIVFCTKKGHNGQKGIISAVTFRDEETFYAGSYSSSIYLHDLRNESISIHIGAKSPSLGGVVQVESLDENRMLSGHRQDESVYCWDIRKPDEWIFKLERRAKNFQKFEFDVYKDRYLLAGDQDGDLLIYDVVDGSQISRTSITPGISVVSVACSEGRVITGSGVRSFPKVGTVDDSSDDEMELDNYSRIAFHSISI